MDVSNPYQAPSADLGPATLGGEAELADAVQPFVASRKPLIALAVINVVFALGSACAIATTQTMTSELATRTTSTFALIAVGYLVGAVILFRMASGMRALASDPTLGKVVTALNRLTETWTISVVVLVAVTVGSWAQRLATASAVTPVMWQLGPSDPLLAAAARLRRVLLVVVGVALFTMAVGIIGLFVLPTPENQAMSAAAVRGITLGACIFQLGGVWLVWRQVPLLAAFIAKPSAAALKSVAAAHQLIWRIVAWGLVVLFVGAMAVAVTMPFMLRGRAAQIHANP